MSISLDLAQMLLQELGPQTPELDAVLQENEKSWLLVFGDEQSIYVEWANNPDRLVLTTGLGRPVEGNELQVYETLLSYNLLWQDTGGVRMAIDGPQGEIMLIYDLFDDQLSLAELQTVVLNITSIAAIWRDYVQKESAANALPPISSEPCICAPEGMVMSGPRNISGSSIAKLPLERGTTSSQSPEHLRPTPSVGQAESKEKPPVHETSAAHQSTEPKLEPKKGIVGLNAGLELLERHLASVKEGVELKAVPEAPSELHRE